LRFAEAFQPCSSYFFARKLLDMHIVTLSTLTRHPGGPCLIRSRSVA
jgi:hypothetical protein